MRLKCVIESTRQKTRITKSAPYVIPAFATHFSRAHSALWIGGWASTAEHCDIQLRSRIPTMPRTILHVAEKPSVARSISAALSGGGARQTAGGGGQGSQRTVPVFEFDAAGPPYGQCHHIVTSVSGHMKQTDFVPPYK